MNLYAITIEEKIAKFGSWEWSRTKAENFFVTKRGIVMITDHNQPYGHRFGTVKECHMLERNVERTDLSAATARARRWQFNLLPRLTSEIDDENGFVKNLQIAENLYDNLI